MKAAISRHIRSTCDACKFYDHPGQVEYTRLYYVYNSLPIETPPVCEGIYTNTGTILHFRDNPPCDLDFYKDVIFSNITFKHSLGP